MPNSAASRLLAPDHFPFHTHARAPLVNAQNANIIHHETGAGHSRGIGKNRNSAETKCACGHCPVITDLAVCTLVSLFFASDGLTLGTWVSVLASLMHGLDEGATAEDREALGSVRLLEGSCGQSRNKLDSARALQAAGVSGLAGLSQLTNSAWTANTFDIPIAHQSPLPTYEALVQICTSHSILRATLHFPASRCDRAPLGVAGHIHVVLAMHYASTRYPHCA